MILYKNVDICDLDSILERGILSLDESGNGNWDEGKRADNRTDVVYLFTSIEGKNNTFPEYGAALLEVEVENVKKSDFCENDTHKADYTEYITDKVKPEQIKRVIIPSVFKERLRISESTDKMVDWCGMTAEVYGNDDKLEQADEELLEKFSKTAPLQKSNSFNFFRGSDEKRHMVDLYNVKYVFDSYHKEKLLEKETNPTKATSIADRIAEKKAVISQRESKKQSQEQHKSTEQDI